MNALQRFSAAYAITGLSVLAQIDKRDDETTPTPQYVGAHRAR